MTASIVHYSFIAISFTEDIEELIIVIYILSFLLYNIYSFLLMIDIIYIDTHTHTYGYVYVYGLISLLPTDERTWLY